MPRAVCVACDQLSPDSVFCGYCKEFYCTTCLANDQDPHDAGQHMPAVAFPVHLPTSNAALRDGRRARQPPQAISYPTNHYMDTSTKDLDTLPAPPLVRRQKRPPPLPRRRKYSPLGVWYAPSVSKMEASAILRHTPPGHFLVRNDERVPGAFVLCVALDQSTAHIRIHTMRLKCVRKTVTLFVVASDLAFESLSDLLRFFQRTPLHRIDPTLQGVQLTQGCGTADFQVDGLQACMTLNAGVNAEHLPERHVSFSLPSGRQGCTLSDAPANSSCEGDTMTATTASISTSSGVGERAREPADATAKRNHAFNRVHTRGSTRSDDERDEDAWGRGWHRTATGSSTDASMEDSGNDAELPFKMLHTHAHAQRTAAHTDTQRGGGGSGFGVYGAHIVHGQYGVQATSEAGCEGEVANGHDDDDDEEEEDDLLAAAFGIGGFMPEQAQQLQL
ncbi:hypothetical protein PTSG_10618 [Salpingoeca rosetta]|uniref:SH2 domain-containing protein n=1 Tax=Salpingoeca rosetta (strain ATCC 50818 / BSB-021) TaxID=946362 RepID=F2URV8_SALR5|nr:uncharacterized protein PTSG_10618 [Salpingoeca rosetta]EGD80363.1 hypothetical protein PTSG_10618 [Salpingoeca rosetta]|eukprot:XP_004988153.1 hypothetical protein PTSG_10618 [Salpingoeca rosetta]